LIATTLLAQEPTGKKKGPPPEPKNLKLLKADGLMDTMRAFRIALGAKCDTCHVQGDFASDEKPEKEMARKMIVMTREINAKFPDGNQHVSCFTCHRGDEHPKMKPDAAPPAAN
jgi:Photosynthetic reaction centre cytochrome C subunit